MLSGRQAVVDHQVEEIDGRLSAGRAVDATVDRSQMVGERRAVAAPGLDGRRRGQRQTQRREMGALPRIFGQRNDVTQLVGHVGQDDLGRFVLEIADQALRHVPVDDAFQGQDEGVVEQLGAAEQRDGRVVAHQLVGQQFPVLVVVVDAEVAAELEVGQDPLVGRHRIEHLDHLLRRRQPHHRRPVQIALDRLAVGHRHRDPPGRPVSRLAALEFRIVGERRLF